jgi:hypothetical protein
MEWFGRDRAEVENEDSTAVASLLERRNDLPLSRQRQIVASHF